MRVKILALAEEDCWSFSWAERILNKLKTQELAFKQLLCKQMFPFVVCMKCAQGRNTARLHSLGLHIAITKSTWRNGHTCTSVGIWELDRGSRTPSILLHIAGILPEQSCDPFVTVGGKLHRCCQVRAPQRRPSTHHEQGLTPILKLKAYSKRLCCLFYFFF